MNFNQIEDGHVLHLVANPGIAPDQERGTGNSHPNLKRD